MEKGKKYLLSSLFGLGIISVSCIWIQQGCINRWKKQANKDRGLFLLMNQWVNLKQDEKRIENYFIHNKLKRIAIYGMSYVGKRLVKELKDTEVEVIYGIDRDAANIYSEIELVTIDADLKEVDAVVVTSIDEYNAIYNMLSQRIRCPIIAQIIHFHFWTSIRKGHYENLGHHSVPEQWEDNRADNSKRYKPEKL